MPFGATSAQQLIVFIFLRSAVTRHRNSCVRRVENFQSKGYFQITGKSKNRGMRQKAISAADPQFFLCNIFFRKSLMRIIKCTNQIDMYEIRFDPQ